MIINPGRVRYLLPAVFVPVILFMAGCAGSGESAFDMKNVVPGEISGWRLEGEPEIYDRQTIYDYIDGAGEVYLSYGFRQVWVFRYAREDAPPIQAEIFDMSKPEDAYGVFSHARETEETGIGNGYEYRGSLLCFWQGRYYICVLAERQTDESKAAVFVIAEKISAKLPAGGQKPAIISYLPARGLDPSTVRFFHIHSIMNYHYFISEENLLNLGSETEAVLGVYQPHESYLFCIMYPSADQATAAFQHFIDGYLPEAAEAGVAMLENGKWTAAKQKNNFVVVVLDAPDEPRANELAAACLEKINQAAP